MLIVYLVEALPGYQSLNEDVQVHEAGLVQESGDGVQLDLHGVLHATVAAGKVRALRVHLQRERKSTGSVWWSGAQLVSRQTQSLVPLWLSLV